MEKGALEREMELLSAERVRGKYPVLFFIPLFSAHVTPRCQLSYSFRPG